MTAESTAPAARVARVIVISGPSGSGKTRLAHALSQRHGWPFINLDDFYKDADAPDLPRFASGEINWDDAASWDVTAAVSALGTLCSTGCADVPVYSISASRRMGQREARLHDAPFVLAEGIFAPDAIAPLADTGLLAAAWCLRRNRTVTALRRLARDLAERRKPPGVLVRRGWRLWRDEPALIAAHHRLGAEPVSYADANRAALRLAHG